MVLRAAAQALRPPPPLDIFRWARDNVVYEGGEFPGPYDPKLFPFFRRILEVASPSHPAREIVLGKSAQTGGTEHLMIVAGAYLDREPTSVMYVHPSDGNAVRWAKTKWRPFARKIKGLGGLFSQSARDASSTILYQERADGRGFIQISGANSEASLSMLSARINIQDDLSKWKPNAAGDPEVQADSRSMAFRFTAKVIKVGTPLLEDNCKVTRAWKRSTQEQYHVPCPDCGHMHPLTWENFQANLDKGDPDAAHFSCPDCGAVIEERHRFDMMLNGEWVAGNPGAEVVGFHIWSAMGPLQPWAQIARKWLNAQGDPGGEQVFFNDWLGLPYKGVGESPPWEAIRDRAEETGHERGTIPAGGLLLVIGVDCQGDRVEWHAKAFGPNLSRATVDYGVIHGHVSTQDARDGLDELLKRRWPDTFGNQRPADMLAIDFNYAKDAVLDWAKRHLESQVICVRGAKPDNAPELQLVKDLRSVSGKIIKRQRRCFNVGVSPLKFAFYKHLEKADPLARGYCAYPAGMEDWFYQQMTGERRQPVTLRDGSVQYRWIKDKNQPVEVLDTEMYAEAGAIRLGWKTYSDEQWDRLRATRERPPKEPQLDLLSPRPLADGAAAATAEPGRRQATTRRTVAGIRNQT